MPLRSFLARFVCLGLMAAWVGGFTFYGGVVIPTLHGQIGVPQTAGVTRIVTHWLNGLGVASLSVWGLVHWLSGRNLAAGRERSARSMLLSLSIVLLIGLISLHFRMDAILDSSRMVGFYRYHRVYLAASTAQWLANLALMAIGPGDLRGRDRNPRI